MDIESAFRTIPIVPEQWKYLVVRRDDSFWIDKCLPFGVVPATGIHGRTVDALKAILKWHGLDEMFKWVDDMVLLIVPVTTLTGSHFRFRDLSLIDNIAHILGIPLHPDKRQEFSNSVTYVGFHWIIDEKRVEIPAEKKTKYLKKLDSFLALVSAGPVALKDVQSIHGSLMHCTFVVRDGRSRLIRIQRFMCKFAQSHKTQRLHFPRSSLADLDWWITVLKSPSVTRSLVPLRRDDSLELWVDASSGWGIGIVFMNDGVRCYDAWAGKSGWLSEGRNIGWAEMIGLELCAYTLIEFGISDVKAVVRGDNQGSIAALNNLSSRNLDSNSSIQRITAACATFSILIDPIYVNTKVNLADGPSRGVPDPSFVHHSLSFDLPTALLPFLEHIPVSVA